MKLSALIKYTALIFAIILITGCKKSSNEIPLQLTEGSGDYVARITFKDYGSFDLRLFKEKAPDAVDSFVNLAQEGFYDGKTVYSIINDYCLLAGSSENVINSSDSADNFKGNIDDELYPLKGSLCLSDEGKGINAGHFMIISSDSDFMAEMKELLAYKRVTPAEYYKTAYGTELSEEQLKIFEQYGGAPWLYGHCIVFGQIYEGMEVLEKISASETDDIAPGYTPLEDIIIEHIEIK